MTGLYSEDQIITLVARLTHTQLAAFVEAEVVVPVLSESGPVFRQIDIARLELLCDLAEQFDLAVDAIGIVISLVDQLHGVRAELRAVLEAIAAEQTPVRERIGDAMLAARLVPRVSAP